MKHVNLTRMSSCKFNKQKFDDDDDDDDDDEYMQQ